MTTYIYKFPIGDGTQHGHRRCDWYLAKGEKPVEVLQEAHLKCEEVLDFEIDHICGDFEEEVPFDDIVDQICAAGIVERSHFYENFTSFKLFQLWLKILNHINPELKLESLLEDPVESVSTVTCKELEIRGPGYGLLSRCERRQSNTRGRYF